MKDIKKLGNSYVTLKNEEKKLKKDIKSINTRLKDYFNDSGNDELDLGDYTIKKQVQDRSKMDEDRLLNTIRTLGFEECIKTKEYVDIESVNDLIYNKVITPNQIADCVDKKLVTMIKISKNKK